MMLEGERQISNRTLLLSVAGLLLLGSVLRFFQLDVRPVHHDESLHGIYSKYVFEGQPYKYDPMLHGPLLYTVTGWMFTLFGMSTFVLRSLNACLGSLFILSPLLFRRHLSNNAALAAVGFFSISPTMIYWSRFAHHDYLVLSAYTLLAAGLLHFARRGAIVLVLLSFALQYTIKANVFVFGALLLGYLIFDLLVSRLQQQRSVLAEMAQHVWTEWGEFLLALIVAGLAFCALYSGNFRYSEGILDGLYRKVFAYWIEQHKIQRLDGPFAYHLFVLCLYELPLLLMILGAFALTIREFTWRLRLLVFVPSLLLLAAGYFVPAEQFHHGFMKEHLKLTGWFDLWISGTVAILAVLVPLHHRLRDEHGLAFFGYLGLATLWTYGFLGEKVPWLTIYPALALFAYAIHRFDTSDEARLWLGRDRSGTELLRGVAAAVLVATILCVGEALIRGDEAPLPYLTVSVLGWSILALLLFASLEAIGTERIFRAGSFLAAICAILLLHATLITNYTAAGAPSELLSQVHTNSEAHEVFLAMRRELTDPLHPNEVELLVTGSSVWPATWYLADLKGYHFSLPASRYEEMNYIIADETEKALPEDFDSDRLPLQSWWVPDYGAAKLRDIFGYFFTHHPWNPTGSLYVRFLRNNYGVTTTKEPS